MSIDPVAIAKEGFEAGMARREQLMHQRWPLAPGMKVATDAEVDAFFEEMLSQYPPEPWEDEETGEVQIVSPYILALYAERRETLSRWQRKGMRFIDGAEEITTQWERYQARHPDLPPPIPAAV